MCLFYECDIVDLMGIYNSVHLPIRKLIESHNRFDTRHRNELTKRKPYHFVRIRTLTSALVCA